MKDPKTLDEMIGIFEERGLALDDKDIDSFRTVLYDCNYYRLSGYFRAFQVDPSHGDNRFVEGTCVDDFLTPYLMDERLRSLVFEGTSRLERTIGARFSYLLAQNDGAYSSIDENSYNEYHTVSDKNAALSQFPSRQSPRSQLFNELCRWLSQSKEVCIRHYRRRNQPVPIWAAVEAIPFGTLSKMLSLHKNTQVLRELYKSLGFRGREWRTCAPSAIQSMSYLRNMCAHHSRLWKREIISAPPMPQGAQQQFSSMEFSDKSVAKSLVVLSYLVDYIAGDEEYSLRLWEFVNSDASYSDGIHHAAHWE